VLATDLAGVGGPDLPLEVSAVDSFASVTDAPDRSVGIIGRVEVSLSEVFVGERELLCSELDRAMEVSRWLLERCESWLPTED
jgi:hypothetical protein